MNRGKKKVGGGGGSTKGHENMPSENIHIQPQEIKLNIICAALFFIHFIWDVEFLHPIIKMWDVSKNSCDSDLSDCCFLASKLNRQLIK